MPAKLKQFHVRSRETRVYDWYVMAADAEAAREWVGEQSGATDNSASDTFDSTEILDVTDLGDRGSDCRNVAT